MKVHSDKGLKLSPQLTGVAGEHYVAAELTRRGLIASITLRNAQGIDILVSTADALKFCGIQVKTSQGKKPWLLNAKAEKFRGPHLFYVFVTLYGEQASPTFHVVPSEVVAESVAKGHAKWLATPGRGGRTHQDSSVRTFVDTEGKYLERWDLLGF